jgi:hypothetical protein
MICAERAQVERLAVSTGLVSRGAVELLQGLDEEL